MKNKLKPRSCSRYLKGLADPERLKIIECLQGGPRSVGEITGIVHSELANVSHHLAVLRNSQLVRTKRQGKHILYSLNPRVFSHQKGSGDSLNFGCCEVVLPVR